MRHDPTRTDVADAAWRVVLLKAADRLERQGHCRWGRHGDSVCAGIAILEVDGWPSSPASQRASEELAKVVGPNIPRWNDSHSAEEVISTMRAVARGNVYADGAR